LGKGAVAVVVNAVVILGVPVAQIYAGPGHKQNDKEGKK
jgi:hypothetical protein